MGQRRLLVTHITHSINASYDLMCRISDDPNEEERSLYTKFNIAKDKVTSLKKILNVEKNMIAARKKDLLAQTIGAPSEVTQFLQEDATYEEVKKEADEDKQCILVRR